jgi:H+/Cl- antiporter ClcA
MGSAVQPGKKWWNASSEQWKTFLRDREEQVFLVLTLLIGALVGLIVVAFILVTERFGAQLYPPGGAAWRRLLVPVAGSLGMGYLLFRFFPDARGSGVPQTKEPCSRGAAESRSLQLSENSFAHPRRSLVEFHWDARGRPSRLELVLRRCWVESWACGRTK